MAFTFLKTGAASAQMAAKAALEAELRKTETGKMFRFRMKEKEDVRFTFIDGDLQKDGPHAGLLDPPRYYEHNQYMEGNWNNFYVCPEKTNPGNNDKCPLCESGDRAAFVALFTVIDHREVQSKDKTKTYKDQKRLFVAKPQTLEILMKHAIKRGGLAGATFDASRVGDKSAAVGSMFEFVEKRDIELLKTLYMIEKIDPKTNAKTKVTNFTPADYEKEIVYRTGDQLRELLGGKTPATGVKGEDDIPFEAPGGTGAVDYSKDL